MLLKFCLNFLSVFHSAVKSLDLFFLTVFSELGMKSFSNADVMRERRECLV